MNTSPFTPPADRRISRTVGVGIAIVAAIVLTFGLAQFARQKVYISVVAADAAEQPMVTVVTKGHIRDWLPADQALKQGFGLKWGSPEGTVLVVATAPGFAPTAKLVNTRGFRSSDSPHGIIMRRSATVELVASDLPALPETWTDRLAGWQLGFTETDEDFGWVAAVLESLPEGEAKEKLKAAVPVVRLVTSDGNTVELAKAQEKRGYWEEGVTASYEKAPDRDRPAPANLAVYGGRFAPRDYSTWIEPRTQFSASLDAATATLSLPGGPTLISNDQSELRATVTGLCAGDVVVAHLSGDGLISSPITQRLSGGDFRMEMKPTPTTTLRVFADSEVSGMHVELADPRRGAKQNESTDGRLNPRDLFRIVAVSYAGGELGLAGMEPGEYWLHVLAGEKKYSGPVKLAPGTNLARVELTDLPVVSGVLVDDAEVPIEGIRLSLGTSSLEGVPEMATTGPDGAFEFKVRSSARVGNISPIGFMGPSDDPSDAFDYYDQRRRIEFEFDVKGFPGIPISEVPVPSEGLTLILPRRPSDEQVSKVTLTALPSELRIANSSFQYLFVRAAHKSATTIDVKHGNVNTPQGHSRGDQVVHFLPPGIWTCVATSNRKGAGSDLSAIREFEVDGTGQDIGLTLEFKPQARVSLMVVGRSGESLSEQSLYGSVGFRSSGYGRHEDFSRPRDVWLPIGQHKIHIAIGSLRPAPGMDVITVHDQPSDAKPQVVTVPTVPLPTEQIRLTTNYDPDGDDGDTIFTVSRVGHYDASSSLSLSHPDPIIAKNVLVGNGLHPGLHRISWRYKQQQYQTHFFYVDNYDEHFHFDLTPEGTIRRIE